LVLGHTGLIVGKMVVVPPDSCETSTADGVLVELVVILDNLGSKIGHIGSEVGHMGRIVVVCVVVVVVADVVGQIGRVVVTVVLGVLLVLGISVPTSIIIEGEVACS